MDAIIALLERVADHQSFEKDLEQFVPHKQKDGESSICANHQNYRR